MLPAAPNELDKALVAAAMVLSGLALRDADPSIELTNDDFLPCPMTPGVLAARVMPVLLPLDDELTLVESFHIGLGEAARAESVANTLLLK